jgi:hypothetical protein
VLLEPESGSHSQPESFRLPGLAAVGGDCATAADHCFGHRTHEPDLTMRLRREQINPWVPRPRCTARQPNLHDRRRGIPEPFDDCGPSSRAAVTPTPEERPTRAAAPPARRTPAAAVATYRRTDPHWDVALCCAASGIRCCDGRCQCRRSPSDSDKGSPMTLLKARHPRRRTSPWSQGRAMRRRLRADARLTNSGRYDRSRRCSHRAPVESRSRAGDENPSNAQCTTKLRECPKHHARDKARFEGGA